MAVLQNIRNKAGILIMVFVGVALFLFIIDPSTFNGLFNKPETNIAEINGEKVSITEFNNRLQGVKNFVMAAQQTNTIDAETELELRNQVWQEIQNHYLLSESFEDLGISVSEQELEDLLWGSHIHSIIRSNFANPQTGMIDTNNVRQFFETADLDNRYAVLTQYLKSQIILDRELNKYNELVKQSFYTPTALAKSHFKGSNDKVDFDYIAMRYKDISDEDVNVSEEDLKEYYENHKHLFEAEETTREIEYVVFPILPNESDSIHTKDQMEELRLRFENSTDDMGFVKLHSEEVIEKPFFSENEVPGNYGKKIFEDKETGFISDVFTQDTSYMMFKVMEYRVIPDSVKASHILITPDTTRSYQEAFALLDSLKNEIKNGESFSALAKTYSMGPSASKGGDLGWFTNGAMVPQFNDACFYMDEGEMPIVVTQFGVHLIDIEKHSEGTEVAKLALVKKEITASNDTYNKIYSIASSFASNNNTSELFNKAIVEKHLVKKIASNIKENDQDVAGLKDSRSLIKWAYNIEKGSISQAEEIHSENCFVVANLTQVKDKGTIEFEYVKTQIEPSVIKHKKAKILEEKINASLNSGKDLNTIANELGAKVDNAKNITFNSFSVPKLGIEPKLIATAAYGEENKVLGPIEGNNAMYVINITNKTIAEDPENYDAQKTQVTSTLKNRVNYEMFKALMDASEIKDNRSLFY